MSKRRWHVRTVEGGRVRIDNRTYRPDECHRPYDGRLDGLRFAFALYRGQEDLAALWGTEEAYRNPEAEKYEGEEYGPECVDWAFPWYFWHAE